MKILHINAGLEKGGGLFHIINLLSEAKKEGRDITLLCLADGPVASAARKKQLPVHVLGVASRYNIAGLRKLIHFINSGHYDIVHTHGARSNLFLALIKHKIKAKWCVTLHSDPYLDFAGRGSLGKIFSFLDIHALRRADHIFAITQRFGTLLINQAKVNPRKISIIYNGIFFHSNEQIPAKISHSTFNIINVARAEQVKGQKLLLQALAECEGNVHLHIAGDGSQLVSLKKEATHLKIAPQVTFHGFLNQKQLQQLYRKSDLAILTSYSESFPLVLLEASDNLVPIASTAVGDIQKMIPNARMGFVAKIGDANSIAAVIQKALTLPQKDREQMATREKEYLQDNFSVKKQLAKIIAGYHNMLQ